MGEMIKCGKRVRNCGKQIRKCGKLESDMWTVGDKVREMGEMCGNVRM